MSLTNPTTLDRTTHKAIVAHKLKVIDLRRAELEQMLQSKSDNSYKHQELESKRSELLALRGECEALLNPKPEPTRTPEHGRQQERNKLLLRVTLRERTRQAVADAERLEAAGEFRQARLTRATIPELPELICKEFAIDPALLGEIEE